MENVTYKFKYEANGGYPSQVKEDLSRMVKRYAKGGIPHKVGASSDPLKRFIRHLSDDPGWREMKVLYETSSIKNVRLIEDELIGICKEFDIDLVSENKVRGGGGVKEGKKQYYVYILLDR